MKKSAKIQQANNIKYLPSKKTVSVRPKTQMLQVSNCVPSKYKDLISMIWSLI